MKKNEISGQIFKTNNYSMFKQLKGNRPVDQNHVKFLSKSIALNNMLSSHPLIVNEKMEIIDGQHRLEVAKDRKIDIYYFIVEGGSREDALLLNMYTRVWKLSDWLASYVSLGVPAYITMHNFINEHSDITTLSNALLMFYPQNAYTRNTSAANNFKLGRFTADKLDYATEVTTFLYDISGLLEDNVAMDRDFILAVIKASKAIPLKTLSDRIIEVGKRIARSKDQVDYLRQIEEIINWHRSVDKIRVF